MREHSCGCSAMVGDKVCGCPQTTKVRIVTNIAMSEPPGDISYCRHHARLLVNMPPQYVRPGGTLWWRYKYVS